MRTTWQTPAGPRPRALATALLLVCLLGLSLARPLAASATSHQGKDVVAARMLSTGSSFATRIADDAAVFPEDGSSPTLAARPTHAAARRVVLLSSIDDRPTRGPPQDLR